MHDNKKMSKSLGNVVDPVGLVDRFGNDAVRYFLLSETTIAKDGDFSETALVRRTNADLSDCWGNLVHRVLSLIKKNCGGELPRPSYCLDVDGEDERRRVDDALLLLAETTLVDARDVLHTEHDLHKVLTSIMKIPREGMIGVTLVCWDVSYMHIYIHNSGSKI